MWNDPIVDETRKLRESYAAEHNHDIDSIYKDIVRRQNQTRGKVVGLQSRTPESKPRAASQIAVGDV